MNEATHLCTSLKSSRLLLRRPVPTDAPALLSILQNKAVSHFWPDFDADRVDKELISLDPDVTVFVMVHLDEVVGAVQFAEENDPQYKHASIDIFLQPELWGQGLAREAIRTLAEHLFRAHGHHRLVIDPSAENTRAIHVYEKLGFRRVGILRQYERGADGTFHDGMLMELLAGELPD